MEKNKYITLREAAKISGYAPDYIGQLIRKGKLPGKEVYCNTAWLTTEDAVLAYKNRKKESSVISFLRVWQQKALSETKISGLARGAVYGALGILFLMTIAFGYMLVRRTAHINQLEALRKQDEFLKANILENVRL